MADRGEARKDSKDEERLACYPDDYKEPCLTYELVDHNTGEIIVSWPYAWTGLADPYWFLPLLAYSRDPKNHLQLVHHAKKPNGSVKKDLHSSLSVNSALISLYGLTESVPRDPRASLCAFWRPLGVCTTCDAALEDSDDSLPSGIDDFIRRVYTDGGNKHLRGGRREEGRMTHKKVV